MKTGIYFIMIVENNPNGVKSTRVKWGNFKYRWWGDKSTYYAIRFCSPWIRFAERVGRTKIVFKDLQLT